MVQRMVRLFVLVVLTAITGCASASVPTVRYVTHEELSKLKQEGKLDSDIMVAEQWRWVSKDFPRYELVTIRGKLAIHKGGYYIFAVDEDTQNKGGGK
jgi:hypothetical protein